MIGANVTFVGDFDRELKKRQRGRRGGRRRHVGRTDVRKPVAHAKKEPTPVSHLIGLCPSVDRKGQPCQSRLYFGWDRRLGVCSLCRLERRPASGRDRGDA
jgi:hypothetical protein